MLPEREAQTAHTRGRAQAKGVTCTKAWPFDKARTLGTLGELDMARF